MFYWINGNLCGLVIYRWSSDSWPRPKNNKESKDTIVTITKKKNCRMFDNKERKQYKYWSFLMHVLPRIISEWTMNVICKPTAGSTTSISRFLKTMLRKREKMYSVTEKTIWNMKQALLKQKPQLSLTLWNIKNSFLCTRAKAETSAKQLFFQPRDAAAELFSRGIWACELFWKETAFDRTTDRSDR